MDLLDELSDGRWEGWWSFGQVFFDSIQGLVGGKVKKGFFLPLLFLCIEGS